ncbi:MAG: hypothetical protein ACE5E0_00410 [Terriglobia bacterium]
MEFVLRRKWLVLAVLVSIGFLLFVVLPWGYGGYVKSKKASKSQENTQADLGKLYKDALEDVKEKRFDDAAGKFEALLDVAPDYKDARRKLRDTIKKRNETPSEVPPSERTGDAAPGGKDSKVTAVPKRSSPRAIPAEATPLDLLPAKIDGYKTVERKWESPGVEAYGRYDPKDKFQKEKIETVFIVVSKWKSKSETEDRFVAQKDFFPEKPKVHGVNGHSASFGLTLETRPDIFPSMGSLSWERTTWFFAVEVVPISTPSRDYKRAVGLEVASRFGY